MCKSAFCCVDVPPHHKRHYCFLSPCVRPLYEERPLRDYTSPSHLHVFFCFTVVCLVFCSLMFPLVKQRQLSCGQHQSIYSISPCRAIASVLGWGGSLVFSCFLFLSCFSNPYRLLHGSPLLSRCQDTDLVCIKMCVQENDPPLVAASHVFVFRSCTIASFQSSSCSVRHQRGLTE